MAERKQQPTTEAHLRNGDVLLSNSPFSYYTARTAMTRRCAFGGFVDIALHFWGEIPPNSNFWGVNVRF